MTLIELVIVASLLVLLAAIAIPTIQLAVEGRRVREAARAVNVYLGAARNRAMATGRPVGVAFHRFSTDSGDPNQNVCITLTQVEVPPPYAGDELNARALATVSGGALRAEFDPPLEPGRVYVNDRIQFNYQGYWYRITGPVSDDGDVSGNLADLDSDFAQWQERPVWAVPVPYQIRRQPQFSGAGVFRASIAKPLQLPLDAVIDLTFSGGSGGAVSRNAFANGTAPVAIVFSPNGGLERVYVGGTPLGSIETLYLLVGKRERIPPGAAEDGLSNLHDLENLWIAVSAQTGLVTTVENGSVEVGPEEDGDESIDNPIYWARRYARRMETMGGR